MKNSFFSSSGPFKKPTLCMNTLATSPHVMPQFYVRWHDDNPTTALSLTTHLQEVAIKHHSEPQHHPHSPNVESTDIHTVTRKQLSSLKNGRRSYHLIKGFQHQHLASTWDFLAHRSTPLSILTIWNLPFLLPPSTSL